MTSDEFDTTEKLERTDVGYRLTVESTRGTGTRDQDTVKAELRNENRPTTDQILTVCDDVRIAMNNRRNHTPDEESNDE